MTEASVDLVYEVNASQQNAIKEGDDNNIMETFTKNVLANVLPYFIGCMPITKIRKPNEKTPLIIHNCNQKIKIAMVNVPKKGTDLSNSCKYSFKNNIPACELGMPIMA